MPRRCHEFVDSRLRRSPPDRASAVPYGQAGENAMRFPRLAHRSAAAHKLHSTPQQDRMNLISGNRETSSRLPAFSLSSPEAVQTTGTVALLPRSIHEFPVLLATPNHSGLRPSFPARPICCSAFRRWSASLALPTAWPTTPSADFCSAVRRPLGRLSRPEATRGRSPGVSSFAFGAQPPDLRFAP